MHPAANPYLKSLGTWMGREYDKVGPPYKTKWHLSRGIHTLTAVGPGHSGDSVEIEVR